MAKRIAFYTMCTLLVLVVILTGIVIRRVSRNLLWSAPQDPISMNTPTTPTTPTNTEPSNVEDPTIATEPTTATQPTATQPAATQPPATQPPATQPTVTQPTTTEPTEPSHVHTFELTNSVKATCEGYGWNIYTCSTCGYVIMPQNERSEPLGHDNKVSEIVPATCTAAGSINYTCQRCFLITTEEQGAPLGHSFTAQTQVPPTCEEDGFTITHCSRENCQEVAEIIQHEGTATGHTYGAWTYDAGGSAQPLCRVCFADWSGSGSGEPGVYTITSHSYRKLQHPTNGPLGFYEILVSIPGDASAPVHMYSIYDYLDNGTLIFYYDPQLGLVAHYCDQNDQWVKLTADSTDIITIYSAGGTPEESTPPTDAPTEPEATPTEPEAAPTESPEDPADVA